jgi:signal peptidase I
MATDPLPNPQDLSPRPQPAVVQEHHDEPRSLAEHVQSFASIVVIALFIIVFVVQAFRIPSGSMENTLLVGDYLLVDKFAYAPSQHWKWLLPYEQLRRGDIIVFKWPVHPEQHFVKRLIGLPGDRIRLINGKVFVNGQPLAENYAVHKLLNHDPYRDEFPTRRSSDPNINAAWYADVEGFTRNNELLVPQDSYFVLGDNRDSSLDSRYWGFVPRENIVGKPLVIYFSVRSLDDEIFEGTDDKIGRYLDDLRQLPSSARWDRVLRFVK